MYDYNELYQLMERTTHKYNQFEKKKNKYAEGMELTHAEIHTISSIGDHPGLNLTQLAKIKGITKSAASQMVYRLRDKGLVSKEVSPESDAAIVITLTSLGKKAYDGHKEYHHNTTGQFFKILQQIPEESGEEMVKLLQEFDAALDDWINQ